MTTFIAHPQTALLAGELRVPGDKSIGHRALLFSLLADGPVRIVGLGDGADNGRSAKAISALGATVARDGALGIHITSPGRRALVKPAAPIDCGNSGTTIRLLCGLLAGQPFETRLFGDESLSTRPMKRVIEPLSRMGAKLRGAARGADVCPPLDIGPAAGPLTAIDYAMPVASAQVKSAIILAALSAAGRTIVREPGPGRDHTERLLASWGAPMTSQPGVVTIDTNGWDGRLTGGDLIVPGDPSSSAFLIAAAILSGSTGVTIGNVGINPTRSGFLDVLSSMGATVEIRDPRASGGEPVADLHVAIGAAGSLRATTIAGDLTVRSLDEIPILAVVAARAKGTTVIRDGEELRVKESDRIATTAAMLRAFGIEVEVRPDGMAIEGRPDRPLSAAHVDAAGDHRIAMSAAIAALVADGETRIDDADNVATSYPGFVAAMQTLGARIDVTS